MSRRDDLAVHKLKCFVRPQTLIEEKRRFFKRFYRDDRVRLRGSTYRGIGTVIRAAIVEEGGLKIEWDDREGELHLHNPRHVETVWADEKGNEI